MRKAPCDHYRRQREIIGEAICLRAVGNCRTTGKRAPGKPLGIYEARRLVERKYGRCKGRSKELREVITYEHFEFVGYDRILKIADALGIDPVLEIARHALLTKSHLLTSVATQAPACKPAPVKRERRIRRLCSPLQMTLFPVEMSAA